MQKDDRYYSFLYTHSSRSRIYIRRVEVSKKLLRSSAVAAIISVGIAGYGATNFLKNQNSFVAQASNTSFQTPTVDKVVESIKTFVGQDAKAVQPPAVETEKVVQPTEIVQQDRTPNYNRTDQPSYNPNLNQTVNSGGPSFSFQLTNVETEAEENEIARLLDSIQQTSDPAFLPTMWSHIGKINNEFGFRRNPFGGRSYEFHSGLDIDGETGDIVVAPANGTVLKAGWTGGYGNLLEIDHGNGLTTRYGHLSKINVKTGDVIQRGQEVALVGSTGRSTGPHLHYELRVSNKTVNPRRFLPPEPPQIQALADR